jgi:hypothetical protein
MRAAAAALALLPLLAACGDDAPPMPATDCRPVRLIDADTGRSVVGAEDIAIDPAAGIAYVSAHDRRALAEADGPAARGVQAGIYALPLAAGRLPPDSVEVTDLAHAFAAGQPFFPHGIDVYREGDTVRLFAVNRRHGAMHEPEQRTAVEVFDAEPDRLVHRTTIAHPLVCRANDVAALGADRFLVSNDRGACGDRDAMWENVLGLERARVVYGVLRGDGGASLRTVAGGIAFANGLAVGPAERPRVYVAATRGRALLVYRLADLLTRGASEPVDRIALDAGPDNLHPGPPGRLLTAVHPSLMRLWLYLNRHLGVDTAPSRVIEIDLEDGETRPVWADPSGAMLSAATVAAWHAGVLLVGSVMDEGLVACRYGPDAANEGETAP